MDERIKFFIGLDVHKDTIAMAVAEAGRAPARLIGNIAHDVAKLVKLLARYGEAGQVQVVYEAGPTGYGLQRELARRGYHCQVIAPSLIPKRAGDRVKTDHRDGLGVLILALVAAPWSRILPGTVRYPSCWLEKSLPSLFWGSWVE